MRTASAKILILVLIVLATMSLGVFTAKTASAGVIRGACTSVPGYGVVCGGAKARWVGTIYRHDVWQNTQGKKFLCGAVTCVRL